MLPLQSFVLAVDRVPTGILFAGRRSLPLKWTYEWSVAGQPSAAGTDLGVRSRDSWIYAIRRHPLADRIPPVHIVDTTGPFIETRQPSRRLATSVP